jgi:photosynthetic reaction center H subunit
MVGVEFFGNVDLASVSIWAFWLFFAGLIYYLQTENMREGYPLEDEDGNVTPNQGPFPVPKPKTFHLPHGQPDVTVPTLEGEKRELALKRSSITGGFPLLPTGDPLVDGVGPAAWAPRRDEPELDGHGNPKLKPMSTLENFQVSAGRDPRGMPILSRDDQVVGYVTDMWIDEPEALVRYFQYELEPEWGSGTRLVPLYMAKIKPRWVRVRSLDAKFFDRVPVVGQSGVLTKLEEEKVMAFYAGGQMYATENLSGEDVWTSQIQTGAGTSTPPGVSGG